MTDPVTSQVMADEGLRLQVYDDATGRPIVAGSHVIGNPTIGYGCMLSVPGGITEAEADSLLAALAMLGSGVRAGCLDLPEAMEPSGAALEAAAAVLARLMAATTAPVAASPKTPTAPSIMAPAPPVSSSSRTSPHEHTEPLR